MRLDELPAPLELIAELSETRHVERKLLRLHVQELVLEDGGKGQHFPNRLAVARHGEEERKCLDDLPDCRDQVVRNLRNSDPLILRNLEHFESRP